jgi:hypothetical protein
VVMRLFRGKFLAEIARLQRSGQLRLPRECSEERLTSLLNRLGRKKWNVHLQTRYGHGQGVSRYLARYVKGGALSNRQILRVSAHEVAFGYQAHGEEGSAKRSVMTLRPEQFIARVLMHAPEPNRHTVRYVGLYAHGCTGALNQARAAHRQPTVAEPVAVTWQSFLERLRCAKPADRCTQCGATLVRGAKIIARSGAPP